MSNDFRIYTLSDVARILQVCEATVKNYIKAGRMKKINKPGATRVTHTELDRFINGSGER